MSLFNAEIAEEAIDGGQSCAYCCGGKSENPAIAERSATKLRFSTKHHTVTEKHHHLKLKGGELFAQSQTYWVWKIAEHV